MNSALKNLKKWSLCHQIGKKRTIDRVIPPWVSSPYSLFSWWDMEQLSELGLYEIAFLLGQLKPILEANQHTAGFLLNSDKERFGKNLRAIRKLCERLDMQVALSCVEEGLYDLKQEIVTLDTIGKIYNDLSETIRREMQSVNFFYMPFKQTQFYRKNDLFGRKVAERFPSLDYDIREAGNCYAMGRSTACVFHLMRIMEVGTQAFGNLLGVKFTDGKNWQNILDESNKAIKSLPKSPETVSLSQIAAHLYNVKNAWRNQVMHPHDRYDSDEAEDLISHVKAFMKTLAKINLPAASTTV
jgi:hypothetical protein